MTGLFADMIVYNNSLYHDIFRLVIDEMTNQPVGYFRITPNISLIDGGYEV